MSKRGFSRSTRNLPESILTVPHIGLVGCGRWGRFILRDLLSLGASVSVVANGDNARLAQEAGAQVVTRLDDLPPVDGIVVATPTTTHADVIEALLPRGTPIYCEKPLCDDADRARRLAEAGRGRLFVMDKWRYHLGVLALADVARSGELGPVVGLRTIRVDFGHSHPDTDGIWTWLPHDLVIAREIFGRVLAPVAAVADRAGGEIMGLTVMLAADGGPWHVAEVGGRSPERRRTVTLLCRDGVAILQDAYADHLVMVANPPPGTEAKPQITRRPLKVEMPLLAELSAFVGFLNGGPPPKSSVEEAAETVVTIVKLRRLAGL
jgi:predicted dehydrogenase